MTDGQLRLTWELYERACDLPPEERATYLRARSIDAAVVSEVMALLRETEPAGESGSSPAQCPAGSQSRDGSRIGTMVGPYRITGLLGRGGMGEVYSARDATLGRVIALKLLGRAGRAIDVERHIREAKAASALNHPNIISIYHVVESGSEVAIAMELVEGSSFRELCGRVLPVENVCHFGAQVAQALAAAHRQGIIHCDIKPENLMVRPDGHVKVLDFGLAREVTEDSGGSGSGIPLGTLRYMSPEQARGLRLTAASDVFSIGTVLFELASGSHPFPAATAVDAMAAIATRLPQYLSDVNPLAPPQLTALIGWMLAKDPAARPEAGRVAVELKQIAAQLCGREPSAPAHGPAAVLARPPLLDRPPLPTPSYATAAAIAAVAIALGTLAWVLSSRHPVEEALEATPFSADPGVEGQAAMSPGGERVAYVAHDSNHGKLIYVRSLQGGQPVRLTSGTALEEFPAWSPDGHWIAFLRTNGEREADLTVIRAEGCDERRIARLRTPGLGDLTWSPDGNSLVVSTNERPEQEMALYAVPLVGGSMKQITHPPPASEPFGDSTPAISPDGKSMAFSRRLAPFSSDIFIVPLNARIEAAGPARRIVTGKPYNTQPAWTPDGREIVFSSGTLRERRLLRVAQTRDAKPRLLVGAGEFGYGPAFARRQHGAQTIFIYMRRLHAFNIFWLPLDRDAQGIPRPRPEGLRKLIVSNSYNTHPSVSADGTRIAFVSDRAGSPQVWVLDIRTGAETQWTGSACPDVAVPHWSADGRRITYTAQCDNQTDVFVVDGPGLPPLRLTESPALDEISTFSPDGRWVYFTSYRDGGQRIWRVPPVSGQPQRVTHQVSSNAVFSTDGKSIYFSGRYERKEAVWAMPAEGGDAKLLITAAKYFVPTRQGIFFSPGGTSGEKGRVANLAYYDYATKRIHPLPEVEEPDYVFSVPADGSALIYTLNDFLSTQMMKVSEFR
ncbi:MAG: serine/threonine-protein kinase [Acidobacteriota bacterium]|nr:serine/threonine-protein kinase [Acidobacteriota bacterium]